MHPSSTIHTILHTYTLLALALALTSSATLPPSFPAPSTLPPASATLEPRGGDVAQAIPGACGPFDRYVAAPAGTSCERLATDNGITMDELLLMNPDINAGCSNLIAGNSYCVGLLTAIPTPAPAPAAQPTTHSVVVVHKTVTVAPSPIVWNGVCTATPSTCLSGATGTDSVAYTTGCCNGCGPGGSCDLEGSPSGPMTWMCACGGVYRRQAFDGLVENGTWVA